MSKTKVLGGKSHGEVILEDYEQGKDGQLWKKGEPDAEGYFTIENSGSGVENYYEVPKFMTSISESGLEIKGNITMGWISS